MTAVGGGPELLRDDLEALALLVGQTAAHLGVDVAFVEKDFWVTELLRSVAAGDEVIMESNTYAVRTVFKGGTSLSRVHRVIDRFSEDVDILVVFPDQVGVGARDKSLKRIAERARVHLGLRSESCTTQESTRGVKRNVRYAYPHRFVNPSVVEYVLLEMGSRGGPDPHETHTMRSMVAEYADEVLGEGPDTWPEFQPVTVEVLAPERTLLEKLALLHNLGARFPDDVVAQDFMGRAGRHFYDVHQLLNSDRVRAALEELGLDGRAELVDDINERSAAAGWRFVERPAAGYGDSPAFDPGAPGQNVARGSYAVALKMVSGHKPSFDECLDIVTKHRALI